MCRSSVSSLVALFVLAIGLPGQQAWAKPDHKEFLKAARDRGYGEVAVDFLNALKEQNALPPDLKDTFDLEMCDSLRLSVAEAYNPAEAEKRLDAAKVHLERFLKEHPTHESVPKALESAADIAFDRGVQQLRVAKLTKDKEQQTKFYLEARKAFQDSRPRYAQASQKILERLQEMKAAREGDEPEDNGKGKGKGKAKPKPPASAKQRKADEEAMDAMTEWLQSRFKVAMVDYHIAQTYTDIADKDRKAALDSAAKAFDSIYQGQRETMVGTYAHMWHGKVLDEKGDYAMARELYDEVLAIADDSSKQQAGELDVMLAQVEYFRFLIVKRIDGPKAFVLEAEPWLEANKRRLKKAEGYQGVQLEVGKSYLEASEKAPADQKAKLVREGTTMLKDVSKGRGEHAKEALLVLREQRQAAGGDNAEPEKAKTFDEAVALGDDASKTQEWNNAVSAYQQAIEFGTKDKKVLAEIQAKLDKSLFRQAIGFYSAGKTAEACAIAEKIAKSDSPDAAAASSLAVSCKLTLYQSAQDKAAALEDLTELAEFTIKTWPDKAEADDARIALGQASLVQGDFKKAIEVFENVNTRSLRYPVALYLAGQTHWRIYVTTKGQPGAKKEELIAERDLAADELTKSLKLQRDAHAAEKDQPVPKQLTDTQLMLAEIHAEAGDGEKATALLAPMVDAIKASKPEALDPAMIRTFVASVKAYLQLGDLKRAGEVLTVLTAAGPDTQQVNGVLNQFAKILADELQNANARLIEAQGGEDAAAKEKATADVAGAKQLLGSLVGQLSKRQNNTLPSMIYLAELSAKIGEVDSARDLFTAVLPLAEKDEKLVKIVPRLRANLAGLQRQKGEYEAALAQIEAMLKENPNALEPLMEKGRILQAWAEKDPSKFGEAVNHWASLSGKLRASKPQPPEYFEVNYNAALCLVTEAEGTQDQAKKAEKAGTAGKLLKGLLHTKPKLDGPENVARYRELIKRVDKVIPTAGKTAKG